VLLCVYGIDVAYGVRVDLTFRQLPAITKHHTHSITLLTTQTLSLFHFNTPRARHTHTHSFSLILFLLNTLHTTYMTERAMARPLEAPDAVTHACAETKAATQSAVVRDRDRVCVCVCVCVCERERENVCVCMCFCLASGQKFQKYAFIFSRPSH
jgi:hypothetical protein